MPVRGVGGLRRPPIPDSTCRSCHKSSLRARLQNDRAVTIPVPVLTARKNVFSEEMYGTAPITRLNSTNTGARAPAVSNLPASLTSGTL